MHSRNKIQHALHSLGIYCVIISCFFIPFSTSMMGAFSVAACGFWILSGRILSLPHLLTRNKPVLISVILFLLLAIGVSYSPVTPEEGFSVLKKYRELIFLAMIFSLIKDNERAATLALKGFVLGCGVLLLVSYGMYFSILPLAKYGYSTVYHITHSFFMAILAFWCLQHAFDAQKHRYLWLLLLTATVINLFYIAPGRTGMLVFIILLMLTLFQRLRFQHSILGTLVAILIVATAYTTSKNFSSRVNEALDEIISYQAESSRTSLGQRFDWWQNSLDLIIEKPLLGHGTGSFAAAQKKLIQGTKTMPSDNPHNEYLLLAVQTGIVGTALFTALLLGLFVTSFKLQPQRRYLLQGVVIAMAAGCLMNSFLYDSHQGHFFAFISALLCTPELKMTGRLVFNSR